MPNIENFVVNTFRAPRPADVDRDKYSNALLRNEAQRIPQANQAQDLGLKAADQAINQRGTDHARKIMSDMFTTIADNPDMAATIVRTPLFQQAGKDLGYPVEQFTVEPGDDLNEISKRARGWAQVAGAQSQQQQQRVQSTVTLEDGTIGYMTSDGRLVRTNEKARNPLQVVEVGGGKSTFDPRTGAVQPLSTSDQEAAAAAEKKRREAEAAASVIPAEQRATIAQKQPRLAAALRRLDRVEAASKALEDNIFSGGKYQDWIIGINKEGQELEQSNAQLLTEITALTRIPGVGTQSDLEQRLAALQLPTASMHPDVRRNAIYELNAFLRDLSAAMDSVGGAPQQQQGLPPIIPNSSAAQSGIAPEGTVITNQQGQSLVKRNGQWVPQ